MLRENLRLRVLIACGGALVVAAAVILFADRVSQPWARLIDGVGVAVFTTGLVGLIYEIWVRATAVEEVLEIVGLSDYMLRSGLLQLEKYNDVPWRSFFEEHRGDIDIFAIYARTFAGSHADEIALLVAQAQEKRKLRVSLLDPDAPAELLAIYAATFEIDVPTLRQRVTEAIGIWDQAVGNAAAVGAVDLTVERIRTLLPFSFYRSGKFMWIAPIVAQRSGRVGARLPCLLCQQTGTDYGLFDWVMSDIGACRTQGLIVTR